MLLSSKNIFLIDGLGAITTALVLSIILLYFQHLLGMPQTVLFFLIVVACTFSFYSLACHFSAPANWRSFLLFIAISNTVYCCVSIGFVAYHFEQLTWLGITYFVLEVVVIGTLVFMEFKLALT